jgi:pantoate--beta-alanine ligase
LEILYTRNELIKYREFIKNQNKTIGFVPTMGALHQGHMSLIDTAHQNSDIVVASIFINPTQFNNPNDFLHYPITLDQDLELLMLHHCDAVFIPSVDEIYPETNHQPFKVDIGDLNDLLEGEKRPGHFDGVIEIVYILFDLVKPDKVFFGVKDYQQVMVIEKLIEKMNRNIQLFKCNTVRDNDGLAVSSRNKRLNPKEREISLNLYAALQKMQESYSKEDISTLKKSYIDNLNSIENIEVDYLDIVDSHTLKSLKEWNSIGNNLGILAVYVGNVRLIDNLLF